MTNQRKIFGAVLTLAMSAFGVDHWWLGSGSGSEAAVPPPAAPPVAQASHERPSRRGGRPTTADAPTVARAAPAKRPLAERLAEAARAAGLAADAPDAAAAVADAFEPSALWYPAPVAPPPAVARAAPALPPEWLNEFRARHRLTAVMTSARSDGAGGMAIIGGRLIAPGQLVGDGFTLTSLTEYGAVLTRGQTTIELKIDRGDALSSLSGG